MKNPRSRFWYAAIATIVFAFIDQYNLFLKLIGWKRFISEWLIVLGIRNALEVATAFIAVAITHRLGFKRAARELGLLAPIETRACVFAAIATLPMLIAFAFTMPVNPNMTFLTRRSALLHRAVCGGGAVSLLHVPAAVSTREARVLDLCAGAVRDLRDGASCISPTISMELLGIVAITGTGGIGFCWFFMKWRDNGGPCSGCTPA